MASLYFIISSSSIVALSDSSFRFSSSIIWVRTLCVCVCVCVWTFTGTLWKAQLEQSFSSKPLNVLVTARILFKIDKETERHGELNNWFPTFDYWPTSNVECEKRNCVWKSHPRLFDAGSIFQQSWDGLCLALWCITSSLNNTASVNTNW